MFSKIVSWMRMICRIYEQKCCSHCHMLKLLTESIFKDQFEIESLSAVKNYDFRTLASFSSHGSNLISIKFSLFEVEAALYKKLYFLHFIVTFSVVTSKIVWFVQLEKEENGTSMYNISVFLLKTIKHENFFP